MAFMQQQIVFDQWYEIETSFGTCFVPVDIVGAIHPDFLSRHAHDDPPGKMHVSASGRLMKFTECCCSDDILSAKIVTGYGARLSAPGYMDCTEWSVFKTEQAARKYLDETLGDDE